MDTNTGLMIIAIISTSWLSVRLSYFLQDRREKRNDKMDILKSLMVSRKNDEESRTHLAQALNLIDVVFYDSKKVTDLYHAYRTALLSRQNTMNLNDLFVRLVQGIASDLRYCIDGIDIDRCIGYENLTYHDFQSPMSKPP